jgi:hypothetical protein
MADYADILVNAQVQFCNLLKDRLQKLSLESTIKID